MRGDTGNADPRRFGPWRLELWSFVELFAVAGLAFAQPVLDLLGKNPGVFVASDATPPDVVALIAIVLLGPPMVAYGIEVVVALVAPSMRRWAHAALLAGFAGLLVEQMLKQSTSLGRIPLVLGGLVAAVAVGAVVLRSKTVPAFLRVLAIAPLIFALAFVGFSPAGELVFSKRIGGTAGAAVSNPKRVVMIVLDELPLETLLDGEGGIDAELFPNFARLASTSTWFRNTTTVDGYTEQAVPALATGRYPSDPSDLPVAADHPDSIFGLLGGTYRMNVHESVARLCPDDVCGGVDSGTRSGSSLGELLKSTQDLWSEFASPRRVASGPAAVPLSLFNPMSNANRFLESLRPSDEPVFDYLHVLLPHQAWRFLPNGQYVEPLAADPTLAAAMGSAWRSQWAAWIGRERHVLQVQAVDAFLGRVITKLQRIGAWDDSVVAVTADHGIGFTVDEPARWVADRNTAQIAWIPLFVKVPGQEGGSIDDRAMQTIDVMPTITDVLRVKVPWAVDGTSGFGAPRPDSRRRLYQWRSATRLAPPPKAKIAAGDGYFSVDSVKGFSEVISANANSRTGDPSLRPYRIGPYGSLIGQDARPLVGSPARNTQVTWSNGVSFDRIDPAAPSAPWAQLEGTVTGASGDEPLAIVVNDVIAGLSSIDAAGSGQRGYFLAPVSPSFFRPGANDVAVYAISGPPDRPTLRRLGGVGSAGGTAPG